MLGIGLTYVLGCLWYFVVFSTYDQGEISFYNDINKPEYSKFERLIICCYFILTTLSTVGYGDFTPKSNIEKIIAIFLMILGIAFFSYIMGNFTDIITTYNQKMGIVDRATDLQVWLATLSNI
jgi:hypothetical protein